MYKSNKDMYTVFTNVFSSVVNKHDPLKSRTIRGNQGPFMNRELSVGRLDFPSLELYRSPPT